MAASYPKPDGQKVTRHAPQFGWTDLPMEGRKGKAPLLPKWRLWHAETEKWWKALWATPQATQWKQDGSTLFVLATLYDDLIGGRAEPAKVSAEMRQHEDRHGLNPKAMLQLRWRVTDPDAVANSAPARPKASGSRRDRVIQLADYAS